MILKIIDTIGLVDKFEKLRAKKYFFATFTFLFFIYAVAQKLLENEDFKNIVYSLKKKEIVRFSEVHQNEPSNYFPFLDDFFKSFPNVALANIWLWRDDLYDLGEKNLNSRISSTYYYTNNGEWMGWYRSLDMVTQSTIKVLRENCTTGKYGEYVDIRRDFTCNDYDLMINQGVNRLKEHKVIKKEEHYANRSLILINESFISDGETHNDSEIRKIKNGVYIPIRYTGQVGGYMGAIVIKSTVEFSGEKKAIEIESQKIYDNIAAHNYNIIQGEKSW